VRANRRLRPGGFTRVICQHLPDDVYPQPRSEQERSPQIGLGADDSG
jgi:hypothetical protein